MYNELIQKMNDTSLSKVALLRSGRGRYLLLSLLAGFFVGLGIILIFTIGGTVGDVPYRRTLMGMSFGIALSLVIMAGSELFTGNNLVLTIGAMDGKVSWTDVLRIWGYSWIGNWAGSILVAVLYAQTGLTKGPVGEFMAAASAAKMTAGPSELFFRGVLCNILVCLAVLCSIKLKEEIAKLVMIWWCLFAFITSGFEHSIANMTLLTIGLLVPHGDKVTLGGYFYNIGIVTLGNLAGAVAVLALTYWYIGAGPKKQVN